MSPKTPPPKRSFQEDKEVYLRMLQYLKPYRTRFFIGMLASLPAASLEGLIAWGIGPFLDHLMTGEDYSLLWWAPAVVIAVSLTQGFFMYLSNYCNNFVGTAISRDIRLQMFRHLTSKDYQYFKKHSNGELIQRYVSDPATLQTAIVTNLQEFVIEFFTLIFLAAVLLTRNWMFALVALGIISTIILPLQIISRKVRKLDHMSVDSLSSMVNVFNETIWNAKVVIGFQLRDYQYKRFSRSLDDYFHVSMSILKASTWLKPLMQVIASFGIAAIVLVGTYQVQTGQMTLGDLASFLVALILLYKPVKTVGSIIGKIQRILAPAERVFEKLDTPAEIREAKNPVVIDQVEAIEFQDVSFEYEPGQPVLRNLNFSVKAGELIALVGPSGSGKSTLVDLIPRFLEPNEGRILINGADLREVALDSFRSQISFVSQDPLLLHTSLRENIMLGKLDATEEEVLAAVDAAHLTEVVNLMPDGLDSDVGPWGSLLSGGQKQRVAIARAFIRNAPILILDEATSALDNESEALIQEAMHNIMKNRTAFVIAHRLSTILNADCILVLQDGRIVERGKHHELIAQGGLYNRLYQLQFRHLEEDGMALAGK